MDAPFEVRASFVLGAASVGAVGVVTVGAWIVGATAGADVVGFCRTSLASSTVLAFFLLRLLTLLGAVVVPLLLLVGLARHGVRRSLLPGLVSAVVLWLYVAGVLPQAPRHPCMRSDATPPGDAAQRSGVRPA
ncbi:hypothetical protein [Polyangium mundeleinium]|uniref:DUF1634 domain-containing protein n=1 Tax=Polyangium mundeleinium TaxID=2995306 RepID=A0ABT5EU23_9BACT|nr:hypothetical protein [Polyangium mundeleinium]MDC0745322.1 hypothetical protein [Polyangium mundeleinium]